MQRNLLAERLVRASLAFHDRAPWSRITSRHVFAVRLADQSDPYFASVLGASGIEAGLCLFRGAEAFAQCRGAIAAAPFERVAAGWDVLAVQFEPPSCVPQPYQALLREAKFAGSVAPRIMVKRPVQPARPGAKADHELLLQVLEGIVAADARGLLRPVKLSAHGRVLMWTIVIAGKATAPEVTGRFEPFGADAAQGPAASPGQLSARLTGLTHYPNRWWIAVPVLALPLAGGPGQVPVLLVYDQTDDELRLVRPLLALDAREVAAALAEFCQAYRQPDASGLPAHIAFDRRELHEALAAPLAEAGVGSEFASELPLYDQMVRKVTAMLCGADAAAARDPVSAAGPAEDDVAGWLRLDLLLIGKLTEPTRRHGIDRKARERYLGPDPRWRAEERSLVTLCFGEWLTFHWRPHHNSRTIAERLHAEESLPAPVQRLLAARLAAPLSLFRAGRPMPDGRRELVDELASEQDPGRTAMVHDAWLFADVPVGTVAFGKVYRVGSACLFAPASAPIPPDAREDLRWLRSQGLELSRAGLACSGHLLGRLWSWRARTEE